MKKKIETIDCTSLGTYLANASPQPASTRAQFWLQVSTLPLASASTDPGNTVDWKEVTQKVTSLNPVTLQSYDSASFRNDLQAGAATRKINIFVDENVLSYRVVAVCTACPTLGSKWVAASGSFEV